MKMHREGAALAASVLLVACAPMIGGDEQAGRRSSKNQVCPGLGVVCKVDVSCAAGVCVVDPKVLLINGGAPQQKIEFSLNAGYTFPDNGVSFRAPQGMATSDWACQANGPTHFACTAATYHAPLVNVYDVTVKDGAGNALTADPWVVNN